MQRYVISCMNKWRKLMLKKSLLITALGLSLANAGFATSIMHKLQPKKSKPAIIKTTKFKRSDYTDFSGKWTGRCNDATEPYTLEVENSEYEINIDHEEFLIGSGLNTEADSSVFGSFSNTSFIRWNEDKTALILNDVMYIFSYKSTTPPGEGEPLQVEVSRGTMQLKDGNLVISGNEYSFVDGKDYGTDSFECVFTKQ
jgi:hypothetical protein